MFKFSNNIGCQICISQYNIQLGSWFFYLKLFRTLNVCFKSIDFEIQRLEFLNDIEGSPSLTKVVVPNQIYMFTIDKFFIGSLLASQIFVLDSHVLRFKISNSQIISDGDTSYTKVVVFDKISNLVVETFFIWIKLVAKNIQYMIVKCLYKNIAFYLAINEFVV